MVSTVSTGINVPQIYPQVITNNASHYQIINIEEAEVNYENYQVSMVSIKALSKEWLNPVEDEAWQDL